MAAEQVVEHEQRVALAGVDGEHHDRAVSDASTASARSESKTVTFTRATRSAVCAIAPTNQRMTA